MKKVSFYSIFTILIVASLIVSLFFVSLFMGERQKERSDKAHGEAIISEVFKFGNKQYEGDVDFSKKTSNVTIYKDIAHYFAEVDTQIEDKTTNNGVRHHIYMIDKHEPFAITQDDIKVYGNDEIPEDKEFIYEIKNVTISTTKSE